MEDFSPAPRFLIVEDNDDEAALVQDTLALMGIENVIRLDSTNKPIEQVRSEILLLIGELGILHTVFLDGLYKYGATVLELIPELEDRVGYLVVFSSNGDVIQRVRDIHPSVVATQKPFNLQVVRDAVQRPFKQRA